MDCPCPFDGYEPAEQELEPLELHGYNAARMVVRAGAGGRCALRVLGRSALKGRQQPGRQIRQVEALRSLRHPGLARCFDCALQGGALYIVTEHSTDTLAARIRRQDGDLFPQDAVARWAAGMAEALAYLHWSKLLHRDLRTDNVFVTEDGGVKLGPCGLHQALRRRAHVQGPEQEALLNAAPEVLRGQQTDTRSDLWALGCVLHELAALRRPFQSAQDVTDPNTPPGPLPADCSAELRDLVVGLLHKEPKQRLTIRDVLATLVGDFQDENAVAEDEVLNLSEVSYYGSEDEKAAALQSSRKARGITNLFCKDAAWSAAVLARHSPWLEELDVQFIGREHVHLLSHMPALRWMRVWDCSIPPNQHLEPHEAGEKAPAPGGVLRVANLRVPLRLMRPLLAAHRHTLRELHIYVGTGGENSQYLHKWHAEPGTPEEMCSCCELLRTDGLVDLLAGLALSALRSLSLHRLSCVRPACAAQLAALRNALPRTAVCCAQCGNDFSHVSRSGRHNIT